MDVKSVSPETYLQTVDMMKPNIQYHKIDIPIHLFDYLNSDNCNLDKICLSCLSINSQLMYPLSLDKDENLLSNAYTAVTAIKPHYELPSKVCAACQTSILQFYDFKIQCEKSHYILKTTLLGEFALVHDKKEKLYKGKNENSQIDISHKSNQEKIELEIKVESPKDEEEAVEYIEDISDDEKLSVIVNTIKKRDTPESVTVINESTLVKKNKTRKKRKSHYKCQICSKSFLTLSKLRSHAKKHEEITELPYSCKHCQDSFTSEHDLNLHLSLHTEGSNWKCNKCQKEFNSKPLLRRHIDRHMDSKRYSCETCGKPFAELYALRRHSRVHTGEAVEKKYKCHLCDKRYSDSSALAAHVQRHSGLRPCACDTCGKGFPSARLLASHRRVHSDHKPHACRYCHKRFRHESSRNTHHRTHTGEKPFVCSQCPKTFIQSSNLRQHMRTHTGEKPHTCKVCGNSFSSSSTLKAHERVHTGERPYQCNVCGKRFSRMNLRAHMATHTGERPHECSVCHKRFLYLTRLRDHARVHTGERPFVCENCQQAFPTKSHLVRHVKSHHNDKAKQQIIKNRKTKILNRLINETICDNNKGVEHIEEIEKANDTECRTIMFDTEEGPLEVSGELVLEDDSNIKTEVLVFDNSQNFQSANILNASEIIVNDYANNLVAVSDGDTISATSAVLEGTTVKLYQLDQSLLQIHNAGGRVTISKITSKMTANF